MSVVAYAVAEQGKLLVDTVRSSEGDAKQALLRLQKQQGVTWKTLEKLGYAVVMVRVTVEPSQAKRPPAKRPAQSQPAAPSPPARPLDKHPAPAPPAATLPPAPPPTPADAKPVRRLLATRRNPRP
jgi:hypothetical protein